MPTETKPDARPEEKHDPFVPKTSAVPGVPAEDSLAQKAAPSSPQPAAPDSATPLPDSSTAREVALQGGDSSQRMIAIGACLAAFLILAGLLIVPKLMSPAKPAAQPAQAAATTPSADFQLSAAEALNVTGPVAPGVIATADDLAKPWSSKRFSFRDPLTGKVTPAMVVHIPNAGYWGFSTIEPYGTCQLDFITDLSKLRTDYNYAANHPMVVDPCRHAVFDLLQYSGTPDAEVRGALVQGMGVRPPLAIEIEEHGNEISAVRME